MLSRPDRRLLSLATSGRRRLVLAIALGFGGGALVVWQARLLSTVLDAAFLGGAGLDALAGPLRLLLAVFLVRFALGWASEAAASSAAASVKEGVRGRLLAHLLALGPARRPAERTGELAAVASEGVEALDAWFGQYLPQLAWSALLPLTVLVAVFPFDALTGVALALTGPLIPLFMALIGRIAAPRAAARWESLRALSGFFFDLLQGMATLKVLGRSKAQGRALARASERHMEATLGALRVAFLSALALELLATLGTAVVAVEIGLRLLYGRLAFLDAFTLLVLAPEFYLPLRLLGTRFHAGMAGSAAARRIFELLDRPVGGTSDSIPFAEWNGITGTAPTGTAPTAAPKVRFEDVRLSYPESTRAALDGVSFALEPGRLTAVVGPTGAGKSSLVQLLLRFVEPSAGRIRVDGRDLRELEAEAWRASLAWVPQSPHLFHDTVAQNIRLGRPEATDAEVVRAAERAQAHDFIAALPEGYRTVVGEHGARLSAGQAQRIALARAFLREAPVLLLDEATANLDAETESAVSQATRALAAGRTALVIAHRMSTIYQADKIIVLDGGRVAGEGTHAELLGSCPLYRSLVTGEGGVGGPAEDEEANPPAPVTARDEAARRHHGPVREDGSGALWRLVGLARPAAGGVALSVLLGFGTVAASVGLMATAAYVIAAAALHPSIALLQPAIVGVRFFGLSRGVLRYLERLVSHRVSLQLLTGLRVAFYEAIERLAPARLVGRSGGDLLARALNDVAALEAFFVRALAPPLVACAVAAAAGVFVATFDGRLALLLLGFHAAGGVGLPLAMRWLGARSGRAVVEARARVTAGAVDGVLGMAELVAFGRARGYLVEQAGRGRALAAVQQRVALLAGLQSAGATLVAHLALGAVVVAGILAVRAGTLEGVYLPVLALAALTSFEVVLALPTAAQHLEADLSAARRLFEVMDASPAVSEPVRPEPLPARAGLEMRGLRYRYAPSEAWTLDGVDLDLPFGRHVAVVGRSGSGKTTLARLLVRFLEPTDGTLALGGVELRRAASEEVRDRVGALLQGGHLFDATVRDNLRVARPEASDAELARALERAQAAEFVARLPQGLQTRIGEHGLRLSGGERQRLALARVLLRETPLLVLDEPTAQLDPVTEAKVLEGVRSHCRGRGLLLITHRFVGLESFDEVLVLEAGRLVERGRHEDLLARAGLYARLFALQNRAAA